MSAGTRFITVIFVTALTLSAPAPGQTTEPGERELRLDLFRVISLEGLECGGIKAVKRSNAEDYLVDCENGKHYLIEVTAQKELRVLAPETSKEVGNWSTPLHHVRNLLFAILTLGGHACGEVSKVERVGTADHNVACRDGHRYRVDGKDGGKLRVTPR